MQVLRAAWAWLLARWSAARLGPARQPDAGGRPDERGQTLPEYALILALIAVLAIVSLAFLGGTLAEFFWNPISAEFGKVLDEIFGP